MAEQKPYVVEMNGEQIELTIFNLGVAMFRRMREVEYMDYQVVVEGEENKRHTYLFNDRERLIWMSGLALDKDDAKILQLANRTHGSFSKRYGWRPIVVLEDEPSDFEQQMWAHSIASVDYHKDLSRALRDDLIDE